MAFAPEGMSQEDLELHRDHSRLVTGTVAATLMGHGYQEEGDTSHMDGILRIYAKMRGEAIYHTATNKAMRVGIELEPVAFKHLQSKLDAGKVEGYEDVMALEVLRGLRLDDTDGRGLGFGANIDAPLVHAVGEREDPVSGEMLPMRAYAKKWAAYEAPRQRVIQENAQRAIMGEPLLDVPENPMPEPPYAGVGDLKATMAYDVRLQVGTEGPYPGWIVQLHHYNAALKAKNEQNGYEVEDYPNVLLIGHLYTGDMETRCYAVPYDPKLEDEIARRGALFLDCVEKGISPDSPAVKRHFAPYPVRRTQPGAKLASDDLEKKLVAGFQRLDYCKAKLEEWRELETQTLGKIQELYEGEIDKPGQALMANGREMLLSSSTRNSKQLNREALNAVIDGAAEVRVAVQQAMHALGEGNADKALALLRESRVERLPEFNVRNVDAFESVTTSESAPRFTIKSTKKAQKVYEQLIESRIREEEAEPVVREVSNAAVPASLSGMDEGVAGQRELEPEKPEKATVQPLAEPAPATAPQPPAPAPIPKPFG